MMITKSILGNEPRIQTSNPLGIMPNSYSLYKTNVYLLVSFLTTNEYKTYTIRFFPQLRMKIHIDICIPVSFSPIYEWIPQIHTANSPPITSFTYTFIRMFIHICSMHVQSHVSHACITKKSQVLKAHTQFSHNEQYFILQ